MSVSAARGGRRVELLIQVEYKGEVITEVVLSPFTLGDEEDWQDGLISLSDLLCRKAGIPDELRRALCYPDAETVLEVFNAYLPRTMQRQIMEGRMPALAPEPADSDFEPAPYDEAGEDESPPAATAAPESGGLQWRPDFGQVRGGSAAPVIPRSYAPDPSAAPEPMADELPDDSAPVPVVENFPTTE